MKLILVRHGETEWVRMGKYQGSTDIPLNQRGISQARAVARALKKERPIVVYSSQLVRAHETAKHIVKSCKTKLVIDQRLKEVSFGRWEGKSHRAIRTRFPKASRKWYSAQWTSQPPEGESLRSLERRISSFLKDFRKNFSRRKGVCVIVSHGGPIRMFLISLFKISPEIFWSIRIDPASVSILHLKEKKHELALLNHQEHLNGLKRKH
jgi:alpha-ribazole phosphatase